MDTLDRFGRKCSGDAAVERGTHCIDICPGAHVAVVGILFDRSKSVLEYYGYALVVSICRTRCAEIEKLGFSGRSNRDVVRAYVSVDESLFMHF